MASRLLLYSSSHISRYIISAAAFICLAIVVRLSAFSHLLPPHLFLPLFLPLFGHCSASSAFKRPYPCSRCMFSFYPSSTTLIWSAVAVRCPPLCVCLLVVTVSVLHVALHLFLRSGTNQQRWRKRQYQAKIQMKRVLADSNAPSPDAFNFHRSKHTVVSGTGFSWLCVPSLHHNYPTVHYVKIYTPSQRAPTKSFHNGSLYSPAI